MPLRPAPLTAGYLAHRIGNAQGREILQESAPFHGALFHLRVWHHHHPGPQSTVTRQPGAFAAIARQRRTQPIAGPAEYERQARATRFSPANHLLSHFGNAVLSRSTVLRHFAARGLHTVF